MDTLIFRTIYSRNLFKWTIKYFKLRISFSPFNKHLHHSRIVSKTIKDLHLIASRKLIKYFLKYFE